LNALSTSNFLQHKQPSLFGATVPQFTGSTATSPVCFGEIATSSVYGDTGNYANVVKEIYQKYAPEKLGKLASLLDSYKGREQILIEKLHKKYGIADGGNSFSESSISPASQMSVPTLFGKSSASSPASGSSFGTPAPVASASTSSNSSITPFGQSNPTTTSVFGGSTTPLFGSGFGSATTTPFKSASPSAVSSPQFGRATFGVSPASPLTSSLFGGGGGGPFAQSKQILI